MLGHQTYLLKARIGTARADSSRRFPVCAHRVSHVSHLPSCFERAEVLASQSKLHNLPMFGVAIPNRFKLIRRAFFPLLQFTFVLAPFSGQANPFVVGNTNDSGPGTLRQAINDNNVSGGGNTITFSNVVVGTITLGSGELVISKDVIIIGPGSQLLTLSGNNSNRVFNINSTNAHVDVSGLSL